jgi:hypothetical protein
MLRQRHSVFRLLRQVSPSGRGENGSATRESGWDVTEKGLAECRLIWLRNRIKKVKVTHA